MAKKSSTVYLEEIFWNMITDYQKDKKLGSRNDALQLILQEWDILRKIDFNNIKINITTGENIVTVKQPIVETKTEEKKEEEPKIDPRIKDGIFKITNSMKNEE